MKLVSLFFSTTLLLTVFFMGSSFAQSGKITYYRHHHWSNIATKLPYLSTEEKDRILLTWGKSDGTYKGEPYLLTFNEKGSVYKGIENKEHHGYSWRQDEDVFVRFSEGKTTRDQREQLGKLWTIEEEMPRYKWKMLNELKEIAGYVCMKAETKDTVLDITITAWYTDKINTVSGPEGFHGLPGLILALYYNTDDITIIADKIELVDIPELPVPKLKKGKSTTYEEFNASRKKFVKQSIEGRRNPFWELRY